MTSSTVTSPTDRSLRLDLVRCFAIALLLVGHIAREVRSPIGDYFGWPGLYHVTLGGLAVTVFLVLSGFVLQRRYGEHPLPYGRFILKRILRIYPVYYLCLLVAVAVFAYISWRDTGSVLTGFANLGLADVGLNLTGGYAFAGQWGGPFVATSWFIALIVCLYALFPILARGIRKHPHMLCVSFLIVSVAFRWVLGHMDLLPKRPLDWFPLCRLFEFALGIYLAEVIPRPESGSRVGRGPAATLVTFVSKISFPLFLVHYPLLFLVGDLAGAGVAQWFAIGIYLFASVALSALVLVIDGLIPRGRILEEVADRFGGRRKT